jgi:hypothetical protein
LEHGDAMIETDGLESLREFGPLPEFSASFGVDGNQVFERRCVFPNVFGRRESVSPQAVVLLSRTSDPRSAAHEFRSCRVGLLLQIL